MARGCSTAVRALTKQVLAHVGRHALGVDGRQDVGGNVRRGPAAFLGAAPVFLRGARERIGIGHQVEHAECDGARGRHDGRMCGAAAAEGGPRPVRDGGRPKPVRDIDPRRRRMPAELVDVVRAAGKVLCDPGARIGQRLVVGLPRASRPRLLKTSAAKALACAEKCGAPARSRLRKQSSAIAWFGSQGRVAEMMRRLKVVPIATQAASAARLRHGGGALDAGARRCRGG